MYSNNQYNYQNDHSDYNSGYLGLTWQEYLSGTFRWMTIGLAVTFVTSYLCVRVPALFRIAYSLYLPLTIAELVLVFVLSARVQRIQVSTARGLFLAYSLINGMVFSMYFLIFDVGTLITAFLAAAIFFGLSALHGAQTQDDLSGWGRYLFNGLIAMLVSSLVSMLFGFSFVNSVLYCGIGVLLFLGITAYDTQKLKDFYYYYANDEEMAEKSSIYGALSLYLDFINIFVYLVRMLSRSRRD